MKIDISCFKAYDIRGRVPEELNEDVAYRVGRAYADYLGANKVVVGHDIRLTSASLTDALVRGITDAGCDVIHIGQVGTEEVYFGTFHLSADGGICVTASHNPMDYNGMKFVRENSKPISGDTGLNDIKAMAEAGAFKNAARKGQVEHRNLREVYVSHLLEYVDTKQLKPMKIVCNAGNGGAGAVIDALEPHLPFEFIKVHHQPDGSFPNGIPNPLLPERRDATISAVKESGADLGIAWDGDFDRCFFFDEKGNFIEGYYVVGLLAEAFIQKYPGAKIVHDPRLTWNTIDVVQAGGGRPVMSKTGHAFIKEKMRAEDAVYGGEMSAHHYFRDFAYCDNGSIPWLLVTELLCVTGKSLSELVADRMAKYPCSGEINNTVNDPRKIIESIEKHYASSALAIEKTDGLSMSFPEWRLNIRMSSTEPVLRLNVESRADTALMEAKTRELLDFVKEFDSAS
ncbi:phosphoglucomutase/phosphomannomutase family protein [Teredinibacter turnerae T7901]|uniref:phosphomannomutase n=1 Tax=Teredinibacter turnerae (strain ATCC 39867 / T7901) TaxID=377629 RepID=C5BQA3_TERTT|nr:phosphomannomutase/phosphoglucomutase [Teredinibacter turnerae]ACR11266.1 phosphoglucomutase/phosphomannomutase family protein [Teredinibacter turnerae T7901]